jgi:hypothetical protein
LVSSLSQQRPCFEFISSKWVLEAIEKLQKATISFVMSVCPSVHIEKLGTHWTDFHVT